MITKAVIKEWLEEGKQDNASHMLVVCDTFDHTDYPVYVKENVRRAYTLHSSETEMTRVMEVYSYNRDLESQLAEHRAFHFD